MRCDTADSVEGGTHAGRLQCPASRCLDMADPLLWNRSREPNSGSSRGLRNRPLPCPRYQVTRAQLRSGGQQARDGGATESGPQVGGWAVEGGRTGACRGTAYSGLCSARVGASSSLFLFLPHAWVSAKRKEGGAAVLSLARCNRRAANGYREGAGGGGGSAGLEWADGVMCGTACFWRRRMR